MNRGLVMGLAVVLVAGGVLTVVTGAIWYRRHAEEQAKANPKPAGGIYVGKDDWKNVKWIKDFTLTERSGRRFDSTELDGKVWVVSFFFSSCPGTCKIQNTHKAHLAKKYAPQGVHFVSITCDPETDTPQKLREYARLFEADPEKWFFLTDGRGELLHLQRIGAEVFQVGVDKGQHMNRFTVVDRWGKVRGHFDWTEPAQLTRLEQLLDELLAEKEPPSEAADVAASPTRQSPDKAESSREEAEPDRDES